MSVKSYICIDLKSFYASVECVERKLNPMTTNLVVADSERSDNTICLAITPAMKALGIKNRCRLNDIPQNVHYIIAPPRMKLYIQYSAEIYGIYLKYFSKDDIHPYSVDEAFIDVTNYLELYKMSPKELAVMVMNEVLETLGIRAACGIGTNLYLTKIALDITAKHSEDFIGYLNEDLYKKTLWDHLPLTDFWRVGPGTVNRLERIGIKTMRDIANADENLLYNIFGKDAELLIDHAWGRESVTIADIKAYKSKEHSITSGQVLMRDYSFEEGKLIVKEMMDLLCLDLTDKGLITDSVTLHIRYNKNAEIGHTHGTMALDYQTNSSKIMIKEISKLYDSIVDKNAKIRKVNISCNRVVLEESKQYTFFDIQNDERDKKLQSTINTLHKKYGKNSVLKGMNLYAEATTRERNHQIGGHKSGE